MANRALAVRVEGVSKKYCRTLKRSMLYGVQDITRNAVGLSSRSHRLRRGEFWAVDGVSLEVELGRTLGVIGPNGSGKTTLLKMLCGIFWPDKGKITIRGRVGALIEVGAGFHPLLTGRENVYLNGAILGMARGELDRQFDSIVDFADIGDFIDTPVKHYSSGMFVRLGFSVAVHSSPDILLVDEVLAVGDKEFSIRCYQRIHELKKRGTTILLVSHNEYTIREQTDECLYLHQGKPRFLGPSEEAISLYIREVYERMPQTRAASHPAREGRPRTELLSLRFLDRDSNEVSFVESGEQLTLAIDCRVHETLRRPVFGVNFYDNSGFMYCANSDYDDVRFADLPPGRVTVLVRIQSLHLPTNRYSCSVIVAEESAANLVDWHDMAYTFVVGRAKNARGSLKLPTTWTLKCDDVPVV